MEPNNAETLRQELTREVNHLVFTVELLSGMNLGYLCFLECVYHSDIILLFCYIVLKVSQPDSHSCPEKMLTQSMLLCGLSASLISEARGT